MRVHPRTQAADIAKAQLSLTIWRAIDDAGLTPAEAMMAVTSILNDLHRIMLRRERHPRHLKDNRADEACDCKRCPGNWETAR